jgi:hypothetical protein
MIYHKKVFLLSFLSSPLRFTRILRESSESLPLKKLTTEAKQGRRK